ncbi:MAG: CotH kinase family protein [Verrucomicrobiota bacterium]
MSGSALAKNAQQESAKFFTQTNILTFNIDIAEPEFTALRSQSRSYVRATIQVGDEVFKDVAVRLKGWGTFRPLTRKPSFAVKFNGFVKGQRFHGLSKLMLNNSAQDATYLCELLSGGLFLDAGLPAARVTLARVQLNRRDLGFYVLIEAMNEHFLKRNFTSSTGNLYEGAIQDVNGTLDRDNGTERDQADLRTLFAAANVLDPSERSKALDRVLDVDRFLAFLALEMMTSNWDGYALHRNNYRIYHDPKSDRMVFIPHGMDNTMHETRLSIMPPRKSVLVKALLDTPEGRERYRQKVAYVASNFYRVEVLTNRLSRALAGLKAAARTPAELMNLDRRAEEMRSRIVERAARIADEINGVKPPALVFDESGVARLENWRMERDWVFSPMDERNEEDRETFYINADNGNCNSSWRLNVFLPPGRYRLEGIVHTGRVLAQGSQTGMGAGLRILGNQRGEGLVGDSPWTLLRHDFVVQEGCGNVELMCELRAYQGATWFDRRSLRLVRKQ